MVALKGTMLCLALFFTAAFPQRTSQQYQPQVLEEKVSTLENKVSQLSSRILSLEYSVKELQVMATEAHNNAVKYRPPPSSNQVVGVPEVVQENPITSPVGSAPVDMGDFRPKDCSEIMEELDPKQRHSTFYTIYPISRNRPLEVFCDMATYGGGWTVIQRRGFEGVEREDFNRTWKEYAKGFGNLEADYWLGLDNIAALTKYDDQEVLYEFIQAGHGARQVTTYLNYDKFHVETGTNLYRLHLAGYNAKYSTNLPYYLEKQDGLPFSTKDKDNAGNNNKNCKHYSGWWLQSTICHRQPDLNMPYDDGVLHLHKFNVVQDKNGVSIKVRAKRIVAKKRLF